MLKNKFLVLLVLTVIFFSSRSLVNGQNSVDSAKTDSPKAETKDLFQQGYDLLQKKKLK
jgi:outer membrane protein assembly factor BamD (BamD/ComL family)